MPLRGADFADAEGLMAPGFVFYHASWGAASFYIPRRIGRLESMAAQFVWPPRQQPAVGPADIELCVGFVRNATEQLEGLVAYHRIHEANAPLTALRAGHYQKPTEE